MSRKKPVGWRGESARHSRAARGVRTVAHGTSESALHDEVIEDAYNIGFVEIAHDIERGNIGTAIVDLTEEVRIAEERDEPMMAITPMRNLIRKLERF